MSADRMAVTADWRAVPAADPYPVYAELCGAGPVHKVHVRDGFDAWVVTGYDAVRGALADQAFSLVPETVPEQVREAIAAGHPEERLGLLGRHLLSVDPPDHTRLRRVMATALTPRRVDRLREPITRTVDALLTALRPVGAADLMTEYAVPIAVGVACELLGIPDADRDRFVGWGQMLARDELADAEAFEHVSEQMAEYLVPHVARLRHEPGSDLLSALVAAATAGELDHYEVISLAYQLYFAGHETSACAIASGLLALLLHPDQLAIMRGDTGLLRLGIEEMLRFDGPVKTATWRFTREPVEIGDVVIPAGSAVLAVLASGSRDRRCTPDADTFLVCRERAQHLAFSAGPHYCMGASLARLEMEIAIGHALRDLPGLRLSVPPEQVRWRDNMMMRALAQLPVSFEPQRSLR